MKKFKQGNVSKRELTLDKTVSEKIFYLYLLSSRGKSLVKYRVFHLELQISYKVSTDSRLPGKGHLVTTGRGGSDGGWGWISPTIQSEILMAQSLHNVETWGWLDSTVSLGWLLSQVRCDALLRELHSFISHDHDSCPI